MTKRKGRNLTTPVNKGYWLILGKNRTILRADLGFKRKKRCYLRNSF
nr:MAG TPA: hypothetical protein [Caudoviricetes sp.]